MLFKKYIDGVMQLSKYCSKMLKPMPQNDNYKIVEIFLRFSISETGTKLRICCVHFESHYTILIMGIAN